MSTAATRCRKTPNEGSLKQAHAFQASHFPGTPNDQSSQGHSHQQTPPPLPVDIIEPPVLAQRRTILDAPPTAPPQLPTPQPRAHALRNPRRALRARPPHPAARALPPPRHAPPSRAIRLRDDAHVGAGPQRGQLDAPPDAVGGRRVVVGGGVQDGGSGARLEREGARHGFVEGRALRGVGVDAAQRVGG